MIPLFICLTITYIFILHLHFCHHKRTLAVARSHHLARGAKSSAQNCRGVRHKSGNAFVVYPQHNSIIGTRRAHKRLASGYHQERWPDNDVCFSLETLIRRVDRRHIPRTSPDGEKWIHRTGRLNAETVEITLPVCASIMVTEPFCVPTAYACLRKMQRTGGNHPPRTSRRMQTALCSLRPKYLQHH